MDAITIEEIRDLIDVAEQSVRDVDSSALVRALRAVATKLEEIEFKFNKHGHYVQVSKDSGDYSSDRSGFTGTPQEEGRSGCNQDIQIGE